MSERFDIMREWSSGFAAGITAREPRSLSESDHWIAGWDAGYSLRGEKNKRLDAYLISLGMESQKIIKLAK